MFLVTETWLRPEENCVFSELLPPEYLFFNSPRLTGKGGGLVSVFKQILKCRRIPVKIYPSFEILPFIWTQYHATFCAVIYRPPKSKDFINNFGDFLSTYVPQFDYFLICGDFNIHVESPVDQLANDFNALLDAFDLSQSVQLPTHQRGGTLDLVISRGLVVSIKDVFDLAISDHSVICFEVQGPEGSPSEPQDDYNFYIIRLCCCFSGLGAPLHRNTTGPVVSRDLPIRVQLHLCPDYGCYCSSQEEKA